jgi:hypothetical protein
MYTGTSLARVKSKPRVGSVSFILDHFFQYIPNELTKLVNLLIYL